MRPPQQRVEAEAHGRDERRRRRSRGTTYCQRNMRPATLAGSFISFEPPLGADLGPAQPADRRGTS